MFRSSPISSAALFCAAVLPFASLPCAASAASGNWVDTDTHAISLSNATDLGAAAGSTPLKLLVSLKLQNQSLLYAYFQHITTKGDPLYGHYLSPSEFAASYSPSMSEASAVINYLAMKGFTNITLSPNRTVIRMDGTVALAQAAFNTSIEQFTLNGASVLANIANAQVPAQFANTVLSVTGLNTVPYMKLVAPKHPDGALPPGPPSTSSLSGYTPQNLQTAYDADPAHDGSNTKIAIIAEGDLSTVLTDLVTYEDKYSLPHVPYTVIPTGFDHTDASGADEFDLDTQTSTGIAGNVKYLYIYDGAALNDIELIDEYNRYVTDDLASAASASIAGCESTTYAFGELSAYDQVFIQMATQGQTLFNSTGDSGGSCLNPAGNGIPAGVPGVEFPASSQYVIGVGGTTLLVNDDFTYNYEIAWNSGGGGTSVFEPAPSWQVPVLPTGTADTIAGMKGLPDIAMVADPDTGALVVVNGAVETIGGTSLASPLALGAWSRMQSANNNSLGYAPPALYAMGTAPLTAASGFNDVVVGDNVPFSATPGWDYTTGLGSFDIKAITALLKPVTVTLPTLTPLGGDPCTLPGDLLAVGATGGEIDSINAHNVLNLYIAEPDPKSTIAGNADTFVFTLSVADLSSVPPETAYLVYFYLPDGKEYYVAYEATPDPSATSSFTYGHITMTETATLLINFIPVQDGYLDATSTLDTAHNQVVFVLSKNKLAAISSFMDAGMPGATPLSEIYGESDLETTPIVDNQSSTTTVGTNEVLDDTPQGNYTPVGNASCAASVGGSSSGSSSSSSSSSSGGSSSSSSSGVSSSSGSSTSSSHTSGGASAFGLGSLLVLLPAGLLRRRRRS